MRADATCYRHPDRRASVSCQRCNRPICTECMIQASVGFHCPEDAKQGKQKVYTSSSLFGTSARNALVTYTLIGINAVVFVIGIAKGGSMSGSSGEMVFDYALNAPLMDALGEWYRLVTSGFLHAGLIHIGFNMWALYLLGPQLEKTLGSICFAITYFFCLLCGSLGALILSPDDLTVGASGAIFGLMGVLVILHRVNHVRLMDTGIGAILVVNLLITFGNSDRISVGGHIGGLIGGLVAGWLLLELPRRSRALPSFLPTAAVVALTLAVVAASVWVVDGAADPFLVG
jgi:membrane associated rhomboid family serine protease